MTPLITPSRLADYLGSDSDNEALINDLYKSALGELNSVTERDWTRETDCGQVNEALRIMLYLSYYANRGKADNTEFLVRRLNGIITRLQLTPPANQEEAGNATG